MARAAFRRIQVGKETTRGTLVAATAKLIGSLTLTNQVGIHTPMDERNSLAEFKRDKAVSHAARYRYTGDATYEQLIKFLAMTLKGGVTPTTPTGATLSRDWTFTPSLSAVNTQDSYTVEYGDNTQEWESGFLVCAGLEIGLAMDNVVSLGADMFARFAEKSTFTASLSDPTVNEIIADHCKFYIDGTWAGRGTTEFAAMLAGGTIRLNSGLAPVKYADGLDSNNRANFSTVSERRRSHSMELDLIVSTNFVTQIYDAYVARTAKAIRLEFNDVANSIETSFNRELDIDMFGRFTAEPELFGERDGEDMVRVQFTGYDDGSGNEAAVRVRNNLTSLDT